MKRLLIFLILLLPVSLFSQDFGGKWYSSFTVMGTSMRMNLEVTESPELKVMVINPDMQGAQLECSEASIDGANFYFELRALGLDFNGMKEGDSIRGEMQQHGMIWDVTFTRNVPDKAVVNRPQEPKAPFNYSIDSVQIQNGEISLGATVVLPINFNEKTPILILASGSGPQNRDCLIGGHKPFWVIADHLARNNIACIRFDDRGMGTSTGNYNEASLMDLASDAESVARYVRKKLKYKKNPLGMLGHSEGGMHTLIAANNYKKIDFHIQMATVGSNGMDVLVEQQYDIPKASGASDELCEWNKFLYAGMCNIVLEYPQDIATDSLTAFLGKEYENAPDDFDKSSASRLQFIMGNIMFMNNQWMREFLQFETALYYEKLDVPLLAIHGEKDIQVAPNSNSSGFEGYEFAKLEIMPGLNHLMQHCEDCTMQEYSELEETISLDVLNLISDWILELP
ncbi:alpha/beta hydrolase [Crocinitomicaceae bacterium]|nr:alpha/beta hydrolase [Crocinitomicaceae bacterium]